MQPNLFLSSVEMNGGTVRDGARSAFGVAICKWKWRETDQTVAKGEERSKVNRSSGGIHKESLQWGTHGSEGCMNLLLSICANKKGSQEW